MNQIERKTSALLSSRILSKFLIGDDCWPWMAGKNSKGYGYVYFDGTMVRAHILIYEVLKGKIPGNLELDHTCRNRSCVNPDHVELVTTKVNILRGVSPAAANARKTVCAQGHRLDEKNAYRRPDGGRNCRRCAADWQKGFRRRIKHG
jgi:hypothetical protein